MAVAGKRDFGSFHSSNVRELISLSKDEYSPPPIPIELPPFSERVEFGSPMKEKHFLLDKSWVFLNHGAFGAALKDGIEAAQRWQRYCESQPLRFLDRELLPLIVSVQRRMAAFVECCAEDLVLVPNATTATSTVVQEVVRSLSPGDKILTLNLAHGSTKKLLRHMEHTHGVTVNEVIIQFPVQSGSEIVKAVSEAISPQTKLAVLDHIPSSHGLILPMKELVDICHKSGVEVLVDGAHALGNLPLSLRELDADYYVTNAHKWFCSPKGCALLYVRCSLQSKIRSLVVSLGFGAGFSSEFSWTGLRDSSPYLALLTVLDFWEHYGVERIRSYIHTTAKQAAELLQRVWGTELLCDISLFGSMVLVALPDGLVGGATSSSLTYENAERIQDALYHQFKIEVPMKCIQGKLYTRISAHVYNELQEYQQLADAVIQLKT